MKKILIFLAVIFLMAAGCTKDLTSLNVDQKNPSNAPSYAFFTNGQRALANTLTSSNVNLNIFRLIVQYWQETTYTDESNYDLSTREINDAVWNALYRDALRDFQEAKTLIPKDITDAGLQKNQLAITEIMQIYAFYFLLTTYGNIPYSQALDIDNTFPVYDDAATAYNDLLSKLDAAIANLDASGQSFGTADIIYGGDVALWKKFANSLKLTMGMTISDADANKAKAVVESAVSSGVFTSNDDNAKFSFLATPPNTNPVWVDLVQSGRQDFVAATTIVNEMKARTDPRIPFYFTVDGSNGYSGLDPGVAGSYSAFSKPDEKIVTPDYPATLLDYAEVEFLLAEALQRGFAVGGTAIVHYNNAVTASILDWGGTPAQATAYLAQPSVVYNPANWKKSIGEQKWIALYNRGFEAWIEWRRLDYPQLDPAADADPQIIPVRYPYPVNEQNVNTTNYNAAADAIGGDETGTKLWFDKI
jgi:hypothetical protein